jgi:hypothetical protein
VNWLLRLTGGIVGLSISLRSSPRRYERNTPWSLGRRMHVAAADEMKLLYERYGHER